MSAKEHDGIFEDGRSYTHKAIARIMGKTEEWAKENVIRAGVRFKRLGHLYILSGVELRLWIERGSEPWEDSAE